MYTLKKHIQVPGSLDSVFEFFNRPENLQKLTPASLGFEILTPTPISMHNGAVFDYTVSLFGWPMRWTSIITCYEPPHRFVDIQLKGPYAFWYHEHRFTQIDGGVEVTDEVHYAMPFTFIGKIVHALFVKHQLNTIFAYRSQIIQELFS